MALWKSKLQSEGLDLGSGHRQGLLTNIRFADDLLLFANSLEEAVRMVDLLKEALAKFGLEMNMSKTKMLSTTVSKEDATLIETDSGFIELVAASQVLKYLGRAFSGNLRNRGQAAVDHRISCAWCKFRTLHRSLVDKRVNVKLRLRLFASTVTPTLVYSMDTTPLTEKQLKQVDVVQNKMLRKMVGWIMHREESWEESGHRMKMRMEAALAQYPMKPWSAEVKSRKQKLLSKVHEGSLPQICRSVYDWVPVRGAGRARGRPRTRCFDNI